jgi:hypothetical protein
MVFGHHRHTAATQNTVVEVDAHLEWDVEAVQWPVAVFLNAGEEESRQLLMTALERLGDQIDLGDAYVESIVDSAIFGQAPKGTILAETSRHSIAEEIPETVLQAQVSLVRTAKNAMRDPNPGILEDLQNASAALEAARRDSV